MKKIEWKQRKLTNRSIPIGVFRLFGKVLSGYGWTKKVERVVVFPTIGSRYDYNRAFQNLGENGFGSQIDMKVTAVAGA